jgi:prevent-host-death family protein
MSMVFHIPRIVPVSELARDAREILEEARQRQEPVVITQRGRDAAVLVPIELYRKMESSLTRHIASPQLVNPKDAEHFKMTVTTIEPLDSGDG